jgi:hypothetical protein
MATDLAFLTRLPRSSTPPSSLRKAQCRSRTEEAGVRIPSPPPLEPQVPTTGKVTTTSGLDAAEACKGLVTALRIERDRMNALPPKCGLAVSTWSDTGPASRAPVPPPRTVRRRSRRLRGLRSERQGVVP